MNIILSVEESVALVARFVLDTMYVHSTYLPMYFYQQNRIRESSGPEYPFSPVARCGAKREKPDDFSYYNIRMVTYETTLNISMSFRRFSSY